MTGKDLAKKDDIIFQVGLIALEFARLESALEHCIYTMSLESSAHPRVHKANPTDGFKRKLVVLREFAPWYIEVCKVRRPPYALDELLDGCLKLADRRNQYVHSMAHYCVEDMRGDDSDKFEFLWKKNRREFFGENVEATVETLQQMKDLQREITSAGDFMIELSMEFSHAENRIKEWEDHMVTLDVGE